MQFKRKFETGVLVILLQACSNGSTVPQLSASNTRTEASSLASDDQKLSVESKDVVLEPEGAPISAEPLETSAPKVVTATPLPPPPPPFYPADCLALKKNKAELVSGVYKIYLDAELPTRQAIDAVCDMTTDGGGWTLMLNYNHLAGSNPALTAQTSKLPLMGSDTLGVDESLKPELWGHAGNALLSKFTGMKELRFFCKSSENARIMHFKTAEPGCVAAAKTGTGSCVNIRSSFTALTDHTANLPATIDKADTNQANLVLTSNTFGRNDLAAADPMWNIHGDTNLTSWECDFGSNNAAFNTLHRIWFR